MIRTQFIFALLPFLAVLQVVAQQRPAADVILTNAKIWTVDPERPTAEAVAIIGDRIVAVGSAAEIDRWRGSATKIIDGGGKLVLPGFNDAHVHFSTGGRQLDSVDLRDATSQEEFRKRIAERAKHNPKEWMTGGDWDDQKWTPAKLPTKELIDPVTPNTPVFVNRYDEHMALANSVALKIAGIAKATKAPPGGEI